MRVAREALLFLLALLLLSALLEASGFFEWAAVLAARSARSGAGLLRNLLVLGALITIVLSLDTTAVILTPLVVAAVQRLEVPARPYVLVCVFVSNVASLLLPVSNLTNLLLAAHVPAARFAAAMWLPQLATLAVLWAGLRFACRRELRPRLDTASAAARASAVIVGPAVLPRGLRGAGAAGARLLPRAGARRAGVGDDVRRGAAARRGRAGATATGQERSAAPVARGVPVRRGAVRAGAGGGEPRSGPTAGRVARRAASGLGGARGDDRCRQHRLERPEQPARDVARPLERRQLSHAARDAGHAARPLGGRAARRGAPTGRGGEGRAVARAADAGRGVRRAAGLG